LSPQRENNPSDSLEKSSFFCGDSKGERPFVKTSFACLVGEHSVGAEVRSRGLMERTEETLPARVAITAVETSSAENLRFPGEGQSAQG